MPVETRLLPPMMRALIEVLGFDSTVALLRARGGQRVHVPLSASRWMIDLVGEQGAFKLCHKYGGQELDLPKHDKIVQQLRDKKIRDERNKHSLNELAAKHNLTRRQIQNIVRDVESEEPDLFGFP